MQLLAFGIVKHLAGISSFLHRFWVWIPPHLIRWQKSIPSTFGHPELLTQNPRPSNLWRISGGLLRDWQADCRSVLWQQHLFLHLQVESLILRSSVLSKVLWSKQETRRMKEAGRPQMGALLYLTVSKAGCTAATTVSWGRSRSCSDDVLQEWEQ